MQPQQVRIVSSQPAPTMGRPVTVSGQPTIVASGYIGSVGARPAVASSGGSVMYSSAPRVASPTYVSAAAPRVILSSSGLVSSSTSPAVDGVRIVGGARIVQAPQMVSPGGTVIHSAGGGYVPSASGPVVYRTAAQPARQVVSSGPTLSQAAYEAKNPENQSANCPELNNLKELRKTCGLKEVPVEEGLQTFKAAAVDGKLTREQFLQAYEGILLRSAIELPPDATRNAVFELFDKDQNGIVDMMELSCGISLLCSGTEADKIHAVFNMFDENGDGFISMDEMFKFLTSVFKVVLTPGVMGTMNSMGVTVESPEDLASVTALECFKTADLNHDGKLSVDEFKTWFYAPRNDPSFLFSPVRKLLS